MNPMTRAEKLKALNRRLEYLDTRINAPVTPGGVHWDRAEAAALRWAIFELNPPEPGNAKEPS